MMCLGWFNQMDCTTRPYVEVAPATQTAAEAAGVTGDCSKSLWFWIAGAVIVGAGVLKK